MANRHTRGRLPNWFQTAFAQRAAAGGAAQRQRLRDVLLTVSLGVVVAVVVVLGGCINVDRNGAVSNDPAINQPTVARTWAIALHGGAGTIDRQADPALIAAYRESLERALQRGVELVQANGTALDVAEAVVRQLENDPLFNAGVGAALTARGEAELDAAVMDGRTLSAGAVTGVTTVKNPISLARLVMTNTRHVLLAREGAEEFATAMGVERVPNSYFVTERRKQILREVLEEQRLEDAQKPAAKPPVNTKTAGTVGCVVRDMAGNLAVATSTGGMSAKRYGRVGDSPLIGSGTYANNATCAVSCTGTGEQFIRHGVARMVAARMELAGASVDAAARHLIFNVLNKDDGGLIAVDKFGQISMPYSSEGMYRAAADSSGLRLVKIWE